MAELLGWGVVIALVSLPGLLIPEVIWAMFGGLSFRTPERVEPSKRRYRVARMGSATTFLIGVTIVVAGLWPGTGDEKAVAAFVTSLIGCGLFIAGIVLSIVLRKRRESRTGRLEETDDDLPPDEASEISYGFDYFGIIVYLVLLVVISGSFIGFEQRKQDRIDQITSGPTPLTPDQQKTVDETLSKFTDLHLDRYPVLTEVPEGAVVALSFGYNVVDAAERSPRKVWYQSQPTYDVAPPMGIGEADIALRYPAFDCHVTAIVIQETAETVALGLVVDGERAVLQEGTGYASCRGGNMIMSDIFLVELPTPLGDRALVKLDGSRLPELRYY